MSEIFENPFKDCWFLIAMSSTLIMIVVYWVVDAHWGCYVTTSPIYWHYVPEAIGLFFFGGFLRKYCHWLVFVGLITTSVVALEIVPFLLGMTASTFYHLMLIVLLTILFSGWYTMRKKLNRKRPRSTH